MQVFKYLLTTDSLNHCIANLIIPAGARIYYEGRAFSFSLSVKIRSNVALVESMHKYAAFRMTRVYDSATGLTRTMHTCTPTGELREAGGPLYPDFLYKTGHVVIPDRFSKDKKECASGIHFFVSLASALAF